MLTIAEEFDQLNDDWYRRRSLNCIAKRLLVVACGTMFIMSTAHVALNLHEFSLHDIALHEQALTVLTAINVSASISWSYIN